MDAGHGAGDSPERFAAIAPVVGGIGPHGPKDISQDISRWARNLAKGSCLCICRWKRSGSAC